MNFDLENYFIDSLFSQKFDIIKSNLTRPDQKYEAVVTKLCSVTKLPDLTVKFFNNFLSTSKFKNVKKSILTLTNGLKSSTEKKKFLAQTYKKNLLKNRLSIRVRNFAPLNEPLNMFLKFFYFNPKVALT